MNILAKLEQFRVHLALILFMVVVLYPKFPLVGVGGTFVSVRLEDFLVAIIVTVFGLISLKSRLKDLTMDVSRAIGLYLIVGVVSLFCAIFVTKTVDIKLGLLHTLRRWEYMSVFWVGFWALSSIKQLNFVIKTVLVVSIIVAVYGLGQQFLGLPVISTTNSEFSKGLALVLGEGARINSTFAGHYDLAAFSLLPLLLCLTMIVLNPYKNLLYVPIFALSYWAMLLSASRTTFAALFVAAAILLVGLRKIKWIFPLGILAVISVILSPQLLGRYRELIINHFTLTTSAIAASKDVATVPDALQPVAEDRSFNIRLKASWPKAMRAFSKNPILGTGYSSVGLAVDSDLLRVFAETGILGFLAFALVFWRIFKKSTIHPYVWAINCTVIGLLLNALFIDIFEASKIAIVIWLLLGISEKVKILAYET